MLTNLIESRGKEFSNLLKIGDYLARSLRENVELFYVDNGKVTYVTESGNVITAGYSFKPYPKLTNIQVDDASVLENESAFNKVTNNKVSNVLSNLLENDYHSAENSFDELLGLFETKMSYDRIKDRLVEKTSRFGSQTKIINTPEFAKTFEIKDKIIDFLKENKNIVKIPEISNGLKLASIVSKSLNLPRVTIDELKESRTFSLKVTDKNSIYEHICRQELIAKEILEAKQNFDTTWADNELISDLASMVFERKRSKIEEKVAEIVSKIPYFALATKKQIHGLIENSLKVTDVDISNKELTSFVSSIYEMKKPVKDYVIKLLNEKYGININNLTDIPTFSNLLKTEMVILTALSKLAPKNSVIKDTLLNLAESLKVKNGAESIDLASFINELFTRAGYKTKINETSLMQYLDFNQVADDLGKIGAVLKLLRPVLAGAGVGGAGGAGGAVPPMGGGIPGAGGQTPPLTKPLPGNEAGAEQGLDLPPELDQEGNPEEAPMGDAEDAATQAQMEDPTAGGMGAEELPPEEGMEGGLDGEPTPEEDAGSGVDPMMDPAMGEEPEDPVSHVTGDDISALVSNIEDLLSSIKNEIGDPGMDMEGGDVPPMEPEGEEAPIDGEPLPDEAGFEGAEGDLPPEDGEEPVEEEPEEDSEEEESKEKKPPKFKK